MNIDFNDIKIIKKLGSGVYGTTYLILYNNTKYALKIQHILPKDKNKNYRNAM
jgi:serine/threonine protein kinase